MKASELRIGNWVCDIYQEEEFQLDIVDMCDMDINGDLYKTDPIPLTEEWLLKFGFECKNKSKIFYKLYQERLHFYDFNNKKYVLGNVDINCNYAHGLQNLYFALTGEELNLKEDESKTN